MRPDSYIPIIPHSYKQFKVFWIVNALERRVEEQKCVPIFVYLTYLFTWLYLSSLCVTVGWSFESDTLGTKVWCINNWPIKPAINPWGTAWWLLFTTPTQSNLVYPHPLQLDIFIVRMDFWQTTISFISFSVKEGFSFFKLNVVHAAITQKNYGICVPAMPNEDVIAAGTST